MDEHAVDAGILRYTLATNLLRAGVVDIVVVAELLGHARLDTTRRYHPAPHTDLEDGVSHPPPISKGPPSLADSIASTWLHES
jgi:site-specific recombinase XerD